MVTRERIVARQAAGYAPANCQKFFASRQHSGYFAVQGLLAEAREKVAPSNSSTLIADQMLSELAALEALQASYGKVLSECDFAAAASL